MFMSINNISLIGGHKHMNYNITVNLITVGIYIAIIVLILVIIKLAIKYLSDRIINLSVKMSEKIYPKLKYKYSALAMELIYCICTIAEIYIYIKVNFIIKLTSMSLYILFIIMLTATYGMLRKNRNLFSIADSIKLLLEKASEKIAQYYLFNFITKIIKQLCNKDTYYLILLVFLTSPLFIVLKWPYSINFSFYIILSLYINVWTYYSYKLKLHQDENIINTRRIFVYLCLVAFSIIYYYSEYINFVNYQKNEPKDGTLFIINLIIIFYITIERVLSIITKDYRLFKENKENQNVRKMLEKT